MTLPAPCARNASIRWTTPAKTISHATTTLTATAARNGEPTAILPNTLSKTPHKMETVEPLFTISTGVFCAIEASLNKRHKRTPKSLEIEEQAQFGGNANYGPVDFRREKTLRRFWKPWNRNGKIY